MSELHCLSDCCEELEKHTSHILFFFNCLSSKNLAQSMPRMPTPYSQILVTLMDFISVVGVLSNRLSRVDETFYMLDLVVICTVCT